MKSLYLILLFGISGYTVTGQCIDEQWHNTSFANSWVSCTPSQNPLAELGMGHWILFEFDEARIIDTIQIWNLNHPELLTSGAKDIRMDVSADGASWNTISTFDVDMAESSKSYTGEIIDDFDPFNAQYILLTVMENYGNICSGLAEVKFSIGETTTATIDEELLSNITIAPNPADQYIKLNIRKINSSKMEIELYDILGRKVYSNQPILSGTEYEHIIDGSSLPDGHYSLRISTEEGFATEQIIVVHPN